MKGGMWAICDGGSVLEAGWGGTSIHCFALLRSERLRSISTHLQMAFPHDMELLRIALEDMEPTGMGLSAAVVVVLVLGM